MNVAFQSMFEAGEGVRRWFTTSLLALATTADGPRCFIYGSDHQSFGLSKEAEDRLVFVPRVETRASGRGAELLRRVRRRLSGLGWEDPQLAGLARSATIDLWAGFCGFEGLGPERPLLVWYPDFQHVRHPEFFGAQEILDRSQQWEYLRRRATGLLVLSDEVASDAVAHGLPRSRVYVCPPAPWFAEGDICLRPEDIAQRYHLNRPYFLVSNQFWQHKNHRVILEAAATLQRLGLPLTVVMTGHTYDYRSPHHFDGLLAEICGAGLWERVRILGKVTRSEQIALMRGAEAVVQPSLFEGRGLVVEEALALGVPVMCSTTARCGGFGNLGIEYFEPRDSGHLVRLLQERSPSTPKPDEVVLSESERRLTAYGESLLGILKLLIAPPRLPESFGETAGEGRPWDGQDTP